jgi:hypothetical protein
MFRQMLFSWIFFLGSKTLRFLPPWAGLACAGVGLVLGRFLVGSATPSRGRFGSSFVVVTKAPFLFPTSSDTGVFPRSLNVGIS